MFSIFHKVKGCGGFEMGLIHVHKIEFKMKSMYKNKKKVIIANWNQNGAQSHKKHTHMAWIWEEPPLSSLKYISQMVVRATSKWNKFLGLSNVNTNLILKL
jgi:hypothetical protein